MTSYPILPSILDRRSVRRYDPRPVERDKILACIEAARFAPSAENVQPWRFVVLENPDVRRALGEKAFSGIYRHTRWALDAPVLVVLLTELNVVTHRIGKWIQGIPFYLLDMGIAGEHFVLQAQELGLGTCWIGWFDVRKTEKFLKVPRNVRACGILALGYPDPRIRTRRFERKSPDEIAHWNGWNLRSTRHGGKRE